MSGRLVYLVCYDICDPKRLRRVYQTMRGYGDHAQLSVFRCELSAAEKVAMMTDLGDLVNHSEDQVMIVPLGPPTGHNANAIETIGVPMVCLERHTVVI